MLFDSKSERSANADNSSKLGSGNVQVEAVIRSLRCQQGTSEDSLLNVESFYRSPLHQALGLGLGEIAECLCNREAGLLDLKLFEGFLVSPYTPSEMSFAVFFAVDSAVGVDDGFDDHFELKHRASIFSLYLRKLERL
ncbi:hypothetical protein C1H46_005479 [Malus baccata]|uniref:Uncharacterized protein n=1 Tax=Malus baccata TaxID=106549 RepID=A0A540NCT9_MALBA|nr:hypothetical protein C1H46_005479 [Malus baccata]